MTREEFEAHVAKVLPEGKTAPEPTDAEYKLIEYVYNFHPATLMEQKERELREAMATLNKVKEEIEEIRRGEGMEANE